MDWIGCNVCGSDPKRVKLLITSCSHIFCTTCYKPDDCSICEIPTKTLEIGPKLPKNVLTMFKDPKEKAAEVQQTLVKVLGFQKFHKENAQNLERTKFVGCRENYMKRTAEFMKSAPQTEKLMTAKSGVEKKIDEKRIKLEKLEELIAKEEEKIEHLKNKEILENVLTPSLSSMDSSTGTANSSLLDYDLLGLNLQDGQRRYSVASSGSSTSSSYRNDDPLF